LRRRLIHRGGATCREPRQFLLGLADFFQESNRIKLIKLRAQPLLDRFFDRWQPQQTLARRHRRT